MPSARAWSRSPKAIGAAAVYGVIRLVVWATADATRYPDTDGYLQVVAQPLFSRGLLAGVRPFGAPLVWKLTPFGDEGAILAQTLLSTVAWLALAVAVGACVRTEAMKGPAAGVVLGFSLVLPVIQWDPILISESVALSTGAATLAAWLLFLRRPSWVAAAAVGGLSAWWVATRDTHAYLLVCVAAVLVVWAVRARVTRRIALGLAAGLALVSVLAVTGASTDEGRLRRWERPLLHVIGKRIIPDPDAAAWFQARGMPLTPRVRELAPKLAAIERYIPPDEETRAFLAWFRADARSTYARYLASHPGEAVAETWAERDALIEPIDDRFRTSGVIRIWPRWAQPLVYPPSVPWLAAAGLVAIAAACWFRRSGPGPLAVVAATLIAVQVPHAVLVVNGDTFDHARHGLELAVALRLSLLLLVVFAVDGWRLGRVTGTEREHVRVA